MAATRREKALELAVEELSEALRTTNQVWMLGRQDRPMQRMLEQNTRALRLGECALKMPEDR